MVVLTCMYVRIFCIHAILEAFQFCTHIVYVLMQVQPSTSCGKVQSIEVRLLHKQKVIMFSSANPESPFWIDLRRDPRTRDLAQLNFIETSVSMRFSNAMNFSSWSSFFSTSGAGLCSVWYVVLAVCAVRCVVWYWLCVLYGVLCGTGCVCCVVCCVVLAVCAVWCVVWYWLCVLCGVLCGTGCVCCVVCCVVLAVRAV